MRMLLTICCAAAALLLVGGCQTIPSSTTAESSNLKANLETLKKTNACRKCYLRDADLQGADLQNTNLRGANLRGAKLDSKYFAMARAQGAIGLDPSGADVAKASPPTKPTIVPAQAKNTTPPSIEIASAFTVREDSPTVRGRVSDNDRVVQVTVEGRTAD